MERLTDLISRNISPEPGRINGPAAHPFDAAVLATGTETEPHAFEITVFNFLLERKEQLGISRLWRETSVSTDYPARRTSAAAACARLALPALSAGRPAGRTEHGPTG